MSDKNINDEKKIENDKVTPLISLFILICLIWFGSIFIITYIFKDWTERGTFGDSFGAINSLFSGLALAGIIYTIFLQRKELMLQRQELIETRKELSRSASAQEKSERALKRQAENLKATARLHALSTLINYYNDRETKYKSTDNLILQDSIEKRKIYLDQIEEILNAKNS